MLNEFKSQMLVGLLNIRDNGPEDSFFGICTNLHSPVENEISRHEVDNFLQEYFHFWPEFSGNKSYPISIDGGRPEKLYYSYSNLWDTETEYGQARYRLLDFLIQTLVDEDRKA